MSEREIHCDAEADRAAERRGAMLLRVFQVLESEGIEWCALHGYEAFPERVESDVDMLVQADALPRRILKLLLEHRQQIGAEVVQAFDGGACFIVLAEIGEEGPPCLLQLHVSRDYVVDDRVLMGGDEILKSRRKHNGFWIPAPDYEFVCVLANRLAKQNLGPKHRERLARLYQENPSACDQRLARLFDRDTAKRISNATQRGDWSDVNRSLPPLREQLLKSLRHSKGATQWAGKLLRWLKPRNGFHVVFLGPDGVGKSTVIEAFQKDLSDAFFHQTYLTFAPSLLPARMAPAKSGGPHSLPPRSWPASLIKAGWWSICYTLGYFISVRPTLARGGMVVNHRYLLDAIVDRRRYRYSGPTWLLKWIWAIAPKPDLIILLDAPPEVIAARKSELPMERIIELREGYRSVVGRLSNNHVIDASQPLAKVVHDVESLVIHHLAERNRSSGSGSRRGNPHMQSRSTAFQAVNRKPQAGSLCYAGGTMSACVATPPQSLTWLHLCPGECSLVFDEKTPAWMVQQASPLNGGGARIGVNWNAPELRLAEDEAGCVMINSRVSEKQTKDLGLSYVRRFAVIPNLREARWFIPLDSGAVSAAAFSLYTPARRSAKIKRVLIQLAAHLPGGFWYRDHLMVALREPPALEKALAPLWPEPVRLALSCGAPEGARNRKASALAIDLRGNLRAFVKLARSDIAREIVAHEAAILPALAHARAPRLLMNQEIDGTLAMAQTPLPGRPAPLAFSPAHAAFLQSLQTSEKIVAAQSPIVQSLRKHLKNLAMHGLSEILMDLVPALEQLSVPVTIVHGDFAPWNLRIDDGAISAFDWEYAQLSGLPLIDEIHYRLQVGLLLEHWSANRGAEEMERLCQSRPRGFSTENAATLAIVYLLDMLARLLTEGYGEDHEMIVWHRAVLGRIMSRRVNDTKGVAVA